MLETTSLATYSQEVAREKVPFVLIPLLGCFKGKTGERNVLLPFAAITKSGIQVRKIIDQLLKVLSTEGKTSGELSPALCHKAG